ncbi:MAG TPA: hypothetical protein ENG01_01270 [Candidatus Aenigmarchaeota archaeon]|nr:MAG: hypothetical protein DRN75_03790 [Nanoarchaeota archaeon]HDO79975.1 hypothetical protein [Candidatus Aenigmarchaeota archaeon]HEX33027.1 hypothetical protein [Candidatus Aenigmarchaeota archaeon]
MKRVILPVVVIIIIAIAIVMSPFYVPPSDYVKNVTTYQKKGPFYMLLVYRYPVKANVTDVGERANIGVSTDKDRINFGSVSKTLVVRKFLVIKNYENKTADVSLYIYGNVSAYAEIMENHFKLAPLSNKTVELKFNATDIGYYTGELDVVMRVRR